MTSHLELGPGQGERDVRGGVSEERDGLAAGPHLAALDGHDLVALADAAVPPRHRARVHLERGGMK